MPKLTNKAIIASKGFIHLIALGWLGLTFYQAVYDQLGADPVKALLLVWAV
jgi:hypothetical protein